MFSSIEFENENIVGLHVSGKLSDAEYDAILCKLNKALQKYAIIHLYTEFENFKGTSIENYFRDLKYAIKNWKRFGKSAIVSERKWVNKWVGVSDKLFSNMEIKAFYFEEKELAKEWVRTP